MNAKRYEVWTDDGLAEFETKEKTIDLTQSTFYDHPRYCMCKECQEASPDGV